MVVLETKKEQILTPDEVDSKIIDEECLRRQKQTRFISVLITGHQRLRLLTLSRAFRRWASEAPIITKCNELSNLLRERTSALDSIRGAYLRDVVTVKYKLEEIDRIVTAFEPPEVAAANAARHQAAEDALLSLRPKPLETIAVQKAENHLKEEEEKQRQWTQLLSKPMPGTEQVEEVVVTPPDSPKSKVILTSRRRLNATVTPEMITGNALVHLRKVLSDVHAVPSADLRPLIDQAMSSVATGKLSAQLLESLITAGLLHPTTHGILRPWERGNGYRRLKRRERGPSYTIPDTAGQSFFPLAAPQNATLLVRYCSECIGTMGIVRQWNEDIERCIRFTLENSEAEGKLSTLRRIVERQQEELISLAEDLRSVTAQLTLFREATQWFDQWNQWQMEHFTGQPFQMGGTQNTGVSGEQWAIEERKKNFSERSDEDTLRAYLAYKHSQAASNLVNVKNDDVESGKLIPHHRRLKDVSDLENENLSFTNVSTKDKSSSAAILALGSGVMDLTVSTLQEISGIASNPTSAVAAAALAARQQFQIRLDMACADATSAHLNAIWRAEEDRERRLARERELSRGWYRERQERSTEDRARLLLAEEVQALQLERASLFSAVDDAKEATRRAQAELDEERARNSALEKEIERVIQEGKTATRRFEEWRKQATDSLKQKVQELEVLTADIQLRENEIENLKEDIREKKTALRKADVEIERLKRRCEELGRQLHLARNPIRRRTLRHVVFAILALIRFAKRTKAQDWPGLGAIGWRHWQRITAKQLSATQLDLQHMTNALDKAEKQLLSYEKRIAALETLVDTHQQRILELLSSQDSALSEQDIWNQAKLQWEAEKQELEVQITSLQEEINSLRSILRNPPIRNHIKEAIIIVRRRLKQFTALQRDTIQELSHAILRSRLNSANLLPQESVKTIERLITEMSGRLEHLQAKLEAGFYKRDIGEEEIISFGSGGLDDKPSKGRFRNHSKAMVSWNRSQIPEHKFKVLTPGTLAALEWILDPLVGLYNAPTSLLTGWADEDNSNEVLISTKEMFTTPATLKHFSALRQLISGDLSRTKKVCQELNKDTVAVVSLVNALRRLCDTQYRTASTLADLSQRPRHERSPTPPPVLQITTSPTPQRPRKLVSSLKSSFNHLLRESAPSYLGAVIAAVDAAIASNSTSTSRSQTSRTPLGGSIIHSTRDTVGLSEEISPDAGSPSRPGSSHRSLLQSFSEDGTTLSGAVLDPVMECLVEASHNDVNDVLHTNTPPPRSYSGMVPNEFLIDASQRLAAVAAAASSNSKDMSLDVPLSRFQIPPDSQFGALMSRPSVAASQISPLLSPSDFDSSSNPLPVLLSPTPVVIHQSVPPLIYPQGETNPGMSPWYDGHDTDIVSIDDHQAFLSDLLAARAEAEALLTHDNELRRITDDALRKASEAEAKLQSYKRNDEDIRQLRLALLAAQAEAEAQSLRRQALEEALAEEHLIHRKELQHVLNKAWKQADAAVTNLTAEIANVEAALKAEKRMTKELQALQVTQRTSEIDLEKKFTEKVETLRQEAEQAKVVLRDAALEVLSDLLAAEDEAKKPLLHTRLAQILGGPFVLLPPVKSETQPVDYKPASGLLGREAVLEARYPPTGKVPNSRPPIVGAAPILAWTSPSLPINTTINTVTNKADDVDLQYTDYDGSPQNTTSSQFVPRVLRTIDHQATNTKKNPNDGKKQPHKTPPNSNTATISHHGTVTSALVAAAAAEASAIGGPITNTPFSTTSPYNNIPMAQSTSLIPPAGNPLENSRHLLNYARSLLTTNRPQSANAAVSGTHRLRHLRQMPSAHTHLSATHDVSIQNIIDSQAVDTTFRGDDGPKYNNTNEHREALPLPKSTLRPPSAPTKIASAASAAAALTQRAIPHTAAFLQASLSVDRPPRTLSAGVALAARRRMETPHDDESGSTGV